MGNKSKEIQKAFSYQDPTQAISAPDESQFNITDLSPEESIAITEKPKYETIPKKIEAGALGAARGFTLGASDLILKGLGYDKEAAKLQAYNPTLSTIGEIAGTGAGVFLGPGELVGAGAKAATAGIASPLAKAATKEAIEGAVYGVGQTVSEQALGSPDDIGQSLLANVGVGSIIGGGAGAAIHGAEKLAGGINNQVKKIFKGDDALSKWLGTTSEYTTEQAAKQPANIELLKKMAEDEGIPLTPGMLSDSELMRGIESTLSQSPTKFGATVREEIQPTFKAFDKQASKVIEEASDQTLYNVGDEIKNELVSRVHQLYDPASTLYKEIGQATKAIEVTPDLRSKIVKSIDDWATSKTLARSEARSAAKDAIQNLSEDIFMPLDKIKAIATNLGELSNSARITGKSDQAYLIGQLKNKIDNFYDRQIRRAAIENAMNQPHGEKIAKDLLGEIKEAKKGWREFRTFMSDVGDEAGLGKIKSFDQFLTKIENIDNEKLATNLFDRKSARSLGYVKENFPEIFDKLRRIEIAKLDAASGSFDPMGNSITDVLKLKKATSKYSPEALEMILGKDKIRTINNLETLYRKLPKRMGPSGTPQGLAYQNILKPAMWAADATSFAIYKHGQVVSDVMNTQTKNITNKIKTFLTNTKKPIVGMSTVGVTSTFKDYDKKLEHIKDVAMNPEQYVMNIQDNTKGLTHTDPDLQQSIANTSMEAAHFLSSKAPQNPFENSMFISPVKWKPSDAELSKFNRYVKAIDDPFSLLDDMNENLLTPESVEAVKTIFPSVYEKIKKIAIEQVGQHGQSLPFNKQLQLSLLLGQPVASAQDISLVQRLQSSGQAQEQEAQASKQQPRQKSKKIEGGFLAGSQSQSENLIRSRGNNL